MSIKYKKFRSFLLPKEMVDFLFISAHLSPLKDSKESEIIVGLSVINDILSKSNQNRDLEDYPFHCIPMDSRYLQFKYGNDYQSYIHWLIINNVIWHDYYFKGRTTHYYLQSNDTYIDNTSLLLNRDGDVLMDVLHTYCLRDSMQITLECIDIKGIENNQKSRMYDLWYSIKVPVTSTNKKFLTKDYEADSKYINNAPKHIKMMGSYFRNNLEIDYDGALSHASTRYQNEIESAINKDEEVSAFKRYSSRIASINGIHNGRNNKTLRFKRNPTNKRLDTNLTNMASDLRPYIKGYENMAYLDLSNSQPVLFNVMLQQYKNKASKELINEINRYLEITTNGKWYEWLQGLFGLTRDECKKIWMKIAYSKNNHNKDVKKVFQKEFPLIYSIIESIKSQKYEQFAISLQIIESEIFIDEICKELVKEGIIPYTMHDGLLVPIEHQQKTLEIMSSILEKKIGAVPNIKIENYKSEQKETGILTDDISISNTEAEIDNAIQIQDLISSFDNFKISDLTISRIIEITNGRYLHKINPELFSAFHKKLMNGMINIEEFILNVEKQKKP